MDRKLSYWRIALAGVVILAAVGVYTLSAQNRAGSPQGAVNSAFEQFKGLKEGKNADYIPALAKVDPNLFGIALVTTDGKSYVAGDRGA